MVTDIQSPISFELCEVEIVAWDLNDVVVPPRTSKVSNMAYPTLSYPGGTACAFGWTSVDVSLANDNDTDPEDIFTRTSIDNSIKFLS